MTMVVINYQPNRQGLAALVLMFVLIFVLVFVFALLVFALLKVLPKALFVALFAKQLYCVVCKLHRRLPKN